MMFKGFIPGIISPTDEFLADRVLRVLRIGLFAISAGALISLMLMMLIYNQQGLELWAHLTVATLFYAVPIVTSLKYWNKRPEDIENPGRLLVTYTFQVVGVILMWNVIGFDVHPQLNPSTRMLAICFFLVIVIAHYIPFVLFPLTTFSLLTLNLVPLSLQLLSFGDMAMVPLALTAFLYIFMLVSVITWLYLSEMENIRSHRGISRPIFEPDMSESGFQKLLVKHLHLQSVQSIILQAATAFFLVFTLRSTTTELEMWSWLMAMIAIQTMRSAEIMKYFADPERFSSKHWRVLFGIGVVANQLIWYAFLVVFYVSLSDFNLGLVSGIFMAVAVLSTIGLAADRIMLYINSVMCLIPPVLIMLFGVSAWAVTALGLLTVVSLLMVVRNIHLSALRSIKGKLLKQLAEFRARQMEELNAELAMARQSLTEVNSSLESQILERTQELDYQANHDMLTGLNNRYRFAAEVARSLKELEAGDTGFVVFLLDLDRFKEINDGLGHHAGDHVLQETAKRLSIACGDTGTCARWGGDEFVVLRHGNLPREEIIQFAEHLRTCLLQPIAFGQGHLTVGASVGISICPEHGREADRLLENADIAVYRAKLLKEGVCIYTHEWGSEAAERIRLAQALRTAIEGESLVLALQPFVAADSGRITGFEALARWPQGDGSVISPGVFIPLAEEVGLMPMLGQWILRNACNILLKIAPDSDLRVAVNISVIQLLKPGFVEEVFATLGETGLPATRLELEMTETVFASDVEHVRALLTRLRKGGVCISIDDFGTGYSSISYLRDFPLDTLKIDRSFVSDLNNGGDKIFRSIVTLAHGLNLSVIVEGVETRKELASVLELGGEEIQGFYFARPMQMEELEQWYPEHMNNGFTLLREDKVAGSVGKTIPFRPVRPQED